jgi:small redox-active disulfide protein 2
MSLFGKKKEEAKAEPCCECCSDAVAMEADDRDDCCCCCSQDDSSCCKEDAKGICCIKVLGSGCKSCHALYENVQEAVKAMGLNIEVEYVTDMERIAGYGVMSTPALVVNEKVVSMGKLLKASDVEKLLGKLEL